MSYNMEDHRVDPKRPGSRSRVNVAEAAQVGALIQRPQPVEDLHRPLAKAALGELLQQRRQGTRIQPTKPGSANRTILISKSR